MFSLNLFSRNKKNVQFPLTPLLDETVLFYLNFIIVVDLKAEDAND